MKKILSILFALILLGSTAACTPASSSAPSQAASNRQGSSTLSELVNTPTAPVTDRAGNPIQLPETINTIVSLSPSCTVVLEDLGLLHKLVAMDSTSAMAYEELGKKLKVLDMMQPDLEQLAALAPDIVFVSNISSGGGADVFATLRKLGICVAEIPTPETVEGILEDVQFIADCTGTTEKGQQLVQQAQNTMEEVKAKLSQVSERPLVYFEISPAPSLYTTGSGTYLNQLIELAGGENVFKQLNSWAAVGEEAVVQAAPQVIFTGVDFMPNPVEEIKSRKAWATIPAVEQNQVYFVAPESSQQPTHRIVEGLLQMAQQLHPQLFT